MTCPFCDFRSEEMKKRIFYRDENSFAILAAPFWRGDAGKKVT